MGIAATYLPDETYHRLTAALAAIEPCEWSGKVESYQVVDVLMANRLCRRASSRKIGLDLPLVTVYMNPLPTTEIEMALTPTEKQRRYRARLKEKKEAALEATTGFLKLPFNEYFARADWSVGEQSLAEVGVTPPTFDADDDPQWHEDWNTFGGMENRGSIGRAERMVGAFLDAATELARIVNQYKREQIDQAISELGDLDFKDRDAKMKALADAARLHKIRDRLDKTVRWSLPEYQIKGDV